MLPLESPSAHAERPRLGHPHGSAKPWGCLPSGSEASSLVVPKLDRLARSVPDARDIADSLVKRGVKLALNATVYDPSDPMDKMFFNILATFAEFEVDLIRMRTRDAHGGRPRQEKAARQETQVVGQAAERIAPYARHGRVFHQRPRRGVLGLLTDRLSNLGPRQIAIKVTSFTFSMGWVKTALMLFLCDFFLEFRNI